MVEKPIGIMTSEPEKTRNCSGNKVQRDIVVTTIIINHMHFRQGFKKETKLGGVASLALDKIVFTLLFLEVFQCAGILRQ